jgi:hypothetical protein
MKEKNEKHIYQESSLLFAIRAPTFSCLDYPVTLDIFYVSQLFIATLRKSCYYLSRLAMS